jgi:hypothetical protein
VRWITRSFNRNIVIQLPTGHGKTLIIAALAMIIAEDLNQKVFIVSMNKFLSQYAHSLFEGMRNIGIFPCQPKPNSVTYITCSELMSFSEKKLNEIVVIFDEIDRCYQDQMLSFVHNSEND